MGGRTFHKDDCDCDIETDMFSNGILSFTACKEHEHLLQPELDALRAKWKTAIPIIMEERLKNLTGEELDNFIGEIL